MASFDGATFEKAIHCVIQELAGAGTEFCYQDVLDKAEDVIVASYDAFTSVSSFKPYWINVITETAERANANMFMRKPSWKAIDQLISNKKNTNIDPSNKISSPNNKKNNSPATASLKRALTAEDRNHIEAVYNNLDRARFTYLEATKDQARKSKESPLSVEEKLMRFGRQCNYHHPCHSLVLDLGDDNWVTEFTDAEFDELNAMGQPLIRPVPDELKIHFDKINQLTTAMEAHNYVRTIDYHPIDDPLLYWFVMTIMSTTKLFLCKNNNNNINDFLESDQMYHMFGFLNTIFLDTPISALGKEKSSLANASTINNKRRLSALDPIINAKMGRKMDTVYLSGKYELGYLEIGAANDQTKHFRDGLVKLPTVMRDSLSELANKFPAIANDIHILGYCVTGGELTLMDMDNPAGYITRIRRLTSSKPYPTSNIDYITSMTPFLHIATMGYSLMSATLNAISQSQSPFVISKPSSKSILPPNFDPSSSSSSTPPEASSSSSSSPKSSSKKSRT